MSKHTFFCIDAHTCGNPVRVVAGGAPRLRGANMSERRQHFLEEYDWIRTGLMFEPRGHDLMSGSMLYPSSRDDCDIGILFIETSGCLPMCGHGTIGTVTVAIEHSLVAPRTPGTLHLETPAGVVRADYEMDQGKVKSVRIQNVPSYVEATGLEVECPHFGPLTVDVAYGGNFYAIVDRQENYPGLEEVDLQDCIRVSPELRSRLNDKYSFEHPDDTTISGLSHILWTGAPTNGQAHARNAVFYGTRAVDRSPCGTGTSARMAQWAARGDLSVGSEFIHESIIGSMFHGRVEDRVQLNGKESILPSIEGWAKITGLNTIFIDEEDDPYAHGFQVS